VTRALTALRCRYASGLPAVLVALALLIAPPAGRAGDFYIDSGVTTKGDGSSSYPFRSIGEAPIRSGNRYLLRRGGVYPGAIEIGGVQNVTIEAWGEGAPPVIDGRGTDEYGIRLVSTRNVAVTGLEIARVRGACVLVLGSEDYRIRSNHLHDALYGVAVNAGKLGPRGYIEENHIHHTTGDGVGAWSLAAGAVIRGNHIHDFGNDGVDVLGSIGAVVEGNRIHDSFDHALHSRGSTHAGIKAGGNRGHGGGRNIVIGNTVYGVKNFGIWNRGAVGNVYRDNTCYGNGVNFSFLSSEGPSRAVVVGNVAREPSFAAGLRYSVAMPAASELAGASGNAWEGGLVRVGAEGVVSDERRYREIMAPLEADTRF
jgi:parallel beta-helix repeat protein